MDRRRRGLGLVGAVLALGMVASGCASLQQAVGLSSPAGNPTPATAIAVSVLADSIYLVDPDTGRRISVSRELTDFQSGYATWSPDHARIAYGDAGIQVVDPTNLRTTTVVAGQGVSMPAWSPRGRQIVYGDGTNMRITPIQKGAAPFTLKLSRTMAPFGFDWAPTSLIAFEGLTLECPVTGACSSTSVSDIYTIRPDGTKLTQVTTSGDAQNPKWSSDGARILYVRSFPRGKDGSQLWVVRANGTQPRQLIPATNVVAADWSRDGTGLVVLRADATTQTLQVWVGGAEGTGLHPVGDPIPGTSATVDW